MLKCRIDISDEALSSAVRAVLELSSIVCSDDDGGILITDSPDADTLLYSGCVMLTRDANMTAELPCVRVLSLPLSYDALIEAAGSFESVKAEPKAISSDENRSESGGDILVRDGCVFFGDKSVQLTERELMLFEFMASRPGEVITRDEIMSCVWSENDGATNVADVYISYLRKKLIPVFGRGVIITVRGEGYMFVKPAK